MQSNNFIDMHGKRYGRLLVLDRAEDAISARSRHTRWNCICDCGKLVTVRSSGIMTGDTRSCGCLRRDLLNEKSSKKSKMPEYGIYRSIISRCLNPNVKRYNNYGGRGINICQRWLDGFENFIADMGERPSVYHSIERIDNNGGYSPENCKWATMDEQAKNRSNNYFIEFGGERMILQDWSKRIGINHSNLKKRIERWGVEEALTRPVKKADCRNKKYIQNLESQK